MVEIDKAFIAMAQIVLQSSSKVRLTSSRDILQCICREVDFDLLQKKMNKISFKQEERDLLEKQFLKETSIN